MRTNEKSSRDEANKSYETRFWMPRVSFSVIGPDCCDFAFGIEFKETDFLFNDHQTIYDVLCCDHRNLDSSLFVFFLGVPTPFCSSGAIVFPTHNCAKNK